MIGGNSDTRKPHAQGVKRPSLMSLFSTIEADKKLHYAALKKVQRTNDATDWIFYFGKIILQAQQEFVETVNFLLKKIAFFDTY